MEQDFLMVGFIRVVGFPSMDTFKQRLRCYGGTVCEAS